MQINNQKKIGYGFGDRVRGFNKEEIGQEKD